MFLLQGDQEVEHIAMTTTDRSIFRRPNDFLRLFELVEQKLKQQKAKPQELTASLLSCSMTNFISITKIKDTD